MTVDSMYDNDINIILHSLFLDTWKVVNEPNGKH